VRQPILKNARELTLKILVTAKRVEDPESKIKVKPDGTGIVKEGLKYKINPFDEIAVEEALRLAAKHGGEVTVLSIGGKEVHEQLRHALAMGAHKAAWVNHTDPLDQMGVASLIWKVVEKEKPDLLLLGKQAIDDDQNQVGQYVAEWLGWSQGTFASKVDSLDSDNEKNKVPGLEVSADGKAVEVVREVDGGLETLQCALPAVVTVDLRLNQPRYASLPGIMKAKSKPIEELTAQALGADVAPKLTVLKVASPPARKAGIKVPDVQTLVEKLKNEAKVV
jgi:electron transfer flavoprotein beta subunit